MVECWKNSKNENWELSRKQKNTVVAGSATRWTGDLKYRTRLKLYSTGKTEGRNLCSTLDIIKLDNNDDIPHRNIKLE